MATTARLSLDDEFARYCSTSLRLSREASELFPGGVTHDIRHLERTILLSRTYQTDETPGPVTPLAIDARLAVASIWRPYYYRSQTQVTTVDIGDPADPKIANVTTHTEGRLGLVTEVHAPDGTLLATASQSTMVRRWREDVPGPREEAT